VHGGAAGQVQAAAARRVAEAAALVMYEAYSPAPNGDGPVDVAAELLRLVAEVRRFADFTGGRVAALTAGEWRPDEPRAAAEVALYERALDRAGRVLAEVGRLGLEERAYKLAERVTQAQAAQATAAVERILVRLGHPHPRQDPAVAAVVVEEFRAIGAGDP
jgi:hypothetical protein